MLFRSSDYVIRQVLDGRKVGTFFTMVDEAGPSVEYQAAEGMSSNLSLWQYSRTSIIRTNVGTTRNSLDNRKYEY